jgi:hypothetical protein
MDLYFVSSLNKMANDQTSCNLNDFFSKFEFSTKNAINILKIQ